MAENQESFVSKVFNGCLGAFLLIVVAPIALISALISSESETVPVDMSAWESFSQDAYQISKPSHLEDYELLKSLSDAGDSEAQFWLAEAYSKGDSVVKNYEDAFNLYLASSFHGNIFATYKAGVAYCAGRGVALDKKSGFNLLVKTRNYSPEAAISIGVLAELGHCSEAGKQDGGPYFNEAIKAGGNKYSRDIGYIYARGKGLPKDKGKAIFWYRLGAVKGDGESQSALGYFLAGKTLGETEKMIAPYAWLAISLSNSHQMSPYQVSSIKDKLNSLEKDMTTEQVSRAQNYAKKCLASNFLDCQI